MKSTRKVCGEVRGLTIASIEAERKAKEAQQAIETAEKERSKALSGKVTFARLVWKELKMSVDVFA